MRTKVFLIAAAGALLWSSAVNAQQTGTESRLVSLFAEVCLQHLGDAPAQARAAAAARWGLAPEGPEDDEGMTSYRSSSERLGISRGGACALTSEMGPAVNLSSVRAVMTEALGTDEGRPLPEPDSRYWLIASDGGEEHVLALKVSNASGRSLATLWVQPRASLARNY